jgi:rhamnosyltransferase
MSKIYKDKYISVFIPTYNAKEYIRECIDSILIQELPIGYNVEIIIIDSGSKDGTDEIIKSYGEKINFIQIPNSEFGHGKTRQKAAELAKGEYILLLSQDATPSHNRWIKNMIEPFLVSDKVGCVFGRQIPRTNSVPTIKREILTVFGNFGAPDSITIHRNKSLVDGYPMNTLNSFFSDVNSAIRKDLIHKVPFRDVKYAEDQALAEDMQNAGYLKAYSVQGSVWHSHNLSVREFYKRKFDEYIGLQESINYKITPSARSLLLGWIRPTIADLKFIRHDNEYSTKRKIKFAFLSSGYNFMSGRGKYDAGKYLNSATARKKISLEDSLK